MKRNNYILYGIITLLIIIILFMSKCSSDLKQENFILTNNTEVMGDSLTFIKGKNDRIYAERGVLISEYKDLENINKELYDDIKVLKKDLKAKPQVVVKYKTRIHFDTLYVDNNITRLDDSTYKIDFNYDTTYNGNNSRELSGNVLMTISDLNARVDKFVIEKDEMNIDATLVLGMKDKKMKVWVTSDFPGFDTESIEAITLDPKIHPELRKLNNKKFTVGPYIGIGIGENFTLTPSIGIGIQYGLFKF